MDRMTADPMKPASYLVHEAERRAYPLSDGPFSIGRDASSNIVIREPAVSRSHAEVRPDEDGFVLTATGATGTRLNGTPITTATKLSDGDRIEIGSAEITYREGRLPLGVSVVDTAAIPSQDADAMTRRPTITNPILGAAPAVPARKKSSAATIVLLLILIAAAVWYFVGR
jgi:pSer/pThr/pTyr-binding forkhead associated (FHA) protein